MNGPSKALVAMFLSAAILCPRPAHPMEIIQFDKLAGADQDDYLTELVIRAERVLRDAGKRDVALQVEKLFTEHLDPADKISLGMAEFQLILARARVSDLRRLEKDPKAQRLEVEHAMIVTLRGHKIELPQAFMTVMKDWKPKFPPKKP